MSSTDRRVDIIKLLSANMRPIKGIDIASKYSVTRQVIVKDIAILRAEGNDIIATPDGYIINKKNDRLKAIIAVSHSQEKLKEEMSIIIKYGGIVEDVVVEHALYGEIKGMLMISNQNEIEKFCKKCIKEKAKLLSVLTDGIHLHTISAQTKENLDLILYELKEKGYIISD